MKEIKPYLLFAWLILYFYLPSAAQQSDMIVLKKRNNRTIQTLFAGKEIVFEVDNHQWIKGRISYIRNDTLFMTLYDIRRIPNIWGTYSIDTISYIPYKIPYLALTGFPKKENLAFIKNGFLFKLGGGGYFLLNVLNGAFLNESVTESRNLGKLATAAGIFGTGFVMGKLHSPYRQIGKKYRLVYVKMTS